MLDFDFLASIAREAGKAILEVYDTDFEVERKDDQSPLTLADKRSHNIIVDRLMRRYPDIPVLSEEGKQVPFEIRRDWDRFWLVDPLDGTKEFVRRNGEFTVNIALVEDRTPVVGIIHTDKKSLFDGFRVSHRVWDHQWIMFTHLANMANPLVGRQHNEYDFDILILGCGSPSPVRWSNPYSSRPGNHK